jgi:hypothetical protein
VVWIAAAGGLNMANQNVFVILVLGILALIGSLFSGADIVSF